MAKNISYLFHVNKEIPIPMYYQIKQSLLEAIKSGVLQGGDMLPAELEICEFCQVSRPTIRQAFSELVSEGYLTRCKGKGTFISRPKIQGRFLNVLQSFNEEMKQKGLEPATKVLKVQLIDYLEEAGKALNCAKGEKLIYLERIRYADKEPIVYVETYIPYKIAPNLLEKDFVNRSLYDILEEENHVKVTRVEREIEAINASNYSAEHLEVEKGKAICLIHTVAYTDGMEPVEYSVARYRGDRSRFNVELCR